MSSKSRRKRRIFSKEFERDAVNLVVVKATRPAETNAVNVCENGIASMLLPCEGDA